METVSARVELVARRARLTGLQRRPPSAAYVERHARKPHPVSADDLRAKIREIPDFPKPGILFYDITTLLKDAAAFKESIDAHARALPRQADRRSWWAWSRVASSSARQWRSSSNAGFVPVRKLGKLPAETASVEYALEYGTNTLEIHKDAIQPGRRCSSSMTCSRPAARCSARSSWSRRSRLRSLASAFLVELLFLKGRERLGDYFTHSVDPVLSFARPDGAQDADREHDPSRREFFKTLSRADDPECRRGRGRCLRDQTHRLGGGARAPGHDLKAATESPTIRPMPLATAEGSAPPQETFRTPYRFTGTSVVVLDQRDLPGKVTTFECLTAADVAAALRSGAVTTGPVMGQVAAYGLALAEVRTSS